MGSKTLDFMRHGEPLGGKRYRGQIDDPLSERGWQQMRDAVADYSNWEAIYTSPLSRCAEFARELSLKLGKKCEDDARLMEIGFGDWEGKTAQALMQDQSDVLYRFWRDPINNRPEGAEKLTDFHDRVTAVIVDILRQTREDHILVVAHAGVIRMALVHALNMSLDSLFRIEVKNASITRIKYEVSEDDCFPRLVFHDGKPSA